MPLQLPRREAAALKLLLAVSSEFAREADAGAVPEAGDGGAGDAGATQVAGDGGAGDGGADAS